MPVLDVFSECVKYKYKINFCSYGTLVVFFVTTITLAVPIIIVHLMGGFWLQNEAYTEIPDVIFKHKYLLLAESREDVNPVICSTFRAYKGNKILDNCSITKVQEVDINKDGLNDVLKFELRFFSKFPIRFMRLLLFFNYELKVQTVLVAGSFRDRISSPCSDYLLMLQSYTKSLQTFHQERTKLTMEAMTVLHYSIPLDVQRILIVGDLRFDQKQLLPNYGVHDIYNHSADINGNSLYQLLTNHAGRKFTTKIVNDALTWDTGFSTEEETVIRAELFYSEEVIHYQPDLWEELKWAYIQYFAFFFVLAYAAKYITKYVFVNRYVRSYVISPLDEKQDN